MLPTLSDTSLKLLHSYLGLLDHWNRVHALTALPPETRFEELILDATVLLPLLEGISKGSKVVDFGTGMGVPAVVLATARPDLQVVALDKSRKKVAFLKQVRLELGLRNLEPLAGRAEELPPLQAAVGVAKAVGSLELLASWWERHALPGSELMALKGPDWSLETVPPGWDFRAHAYSLPTRGERVVVCLKRIT